MVKSYLALRRERTLKRLRLQLRGNGGSTQKDLSALKDTDMYKNGESREAVTLEEYERLRNPSQAELQSNKVTSTTDKVWIQECDSTWFEYEYVEEVPRTPGRSRSPSESSCTFTTEGELAPSSSSPHEWDFPCPPTPDISRDADE